MQTKEFTVEYVNSDPEYRLYFLGDIHAGTIHCVEDQIKTKVKEIAELENTYWLGMGDYGEFITPDDKRWNPDQKSIAPWVEPDDVGRCQEKFITELLTPIKDKCIGLLYGNHENSYRVHKFGNVQKHICEELGVENLGFSCFVRLRFKRESSNESHISTICAIHGSSGAITKGAKVNALRRFMADFEANIYAYGHVHDIDDQRRPYMTVTGTNKIKDRSDLGVLTGCWFQTYTQGIIASYGEMKVYPPTVIGCPYIVLNPSTGEMHAIT